jgi:type II secretory pathway component PulF
MKFSYKAKKGIDEIIDGVIEAQTQEEAVNKLEAQNLFPLSIAEVDFCHSAPIPQKKRFLVRRKVTQREILAFTQKLYTLTKAKVELLSSLKIIYEQTENAALREMLLSIYESTKEGKSFSESLSCFPKNFSSLFINIIKSGETSGRLDYALSQIIEFLQREESLRSKIRVALAYPALLLCVGLASIFVLIVFVIPRLRPIFQGMDQLPLITKIVLKISTFSNKTWVLFFAILVIFAIAIYYRKGIPFFDNFTRKIKTGLPLVKRLIKNQELAHFSRSFAMLLNSGVVALKSLEIASLTVDDPGLKESLKKVYQDVSAGSSISRSLETHTNLPKFFTKMVAVGEESGRIGEVLDELTHSYTQQIETDISLISSLLEPVLILGLGLVLGTIVLSVLLPTFQVTSMVR